MDLKLENKEITIMNSKNTNFGFDFGSMSITRTCQDDKASIVSVSTKKEKFSIRATKNGSIRFFDDQGNECELIKKDYNL